jgi:hypothetical protein
MHVDSSTYITISQGITRGQLPYRDFVDNKGPLQYLLSAPGLLLGRFTGVWITELILMCVSVLFAYKTALFFAGKFMALVATACSFVVGLAFFSACAGTEEYSLPFLMISFYIFTKRYFGTQKADRFIELIVLGFCFSSAVLIRLNMFPLWAGFCAVIFVESIIHRRFLLLGKYMLGFCIGTMIVLIPVYFYLKLNGILSDFINQVIVGGASKGFSGANIKQVAKNFYSTIDRYLCFIPLVTGAFWLITKYKEKSFLFYVGYVFSYILMMIFLSVALGDGHYNMVLVPFFVPALAFIIGIVHQELPKNKYKNIMLIFFLCIAFSEGIVKYLDDTVEIFTNNSGRELVKAGKIIDENTQPDDKIISLGFNSYIYPFTERRSASKYIYQGSGIDHIPGTREEFLSDIMRNKPAIIAIFGAEEGRYNYLPDWYAPIYTMMEQEYTLFSDANGYYLFMRTDINPRRINHAYSF